MRVKRLTLLSRVQARIESDRSEHEVKQDQAALESARNLRAWNAIFAPEWDEFVTKAKTLRKAGMPIPFEIIPKHTDRYNDRSVKEACHELFVRKRFEVADELQMIVDILESSDDETIETKELGLSSLIKSLS